MKGQQEQPGWLLTYILTELGSLRDRVTVLETQRKTSPSKISWSEDLPTSTDTPKSSWAELRAFGYLFVELYKMLRMVPWGLILFGVMAVWHWLLPHLKKLLAWLGVA